MFNWLLRKKQTTSRVPEVGGKAEASVEAEAAATAPLAEASPFESLEAVGPAAPVTDTASSPAPAPSMENASASAPELEPVTAAAATEPATSPIPELPGSAAQMDEAPALAPFKTCGRTRQPFTTGMSRPKPLLVLEGAAGEVDLRADLEVVEFSGRQVRRGKLIAVRADGRRLLAMLGGGGRIRAYTLRRDGIYRLEGANDARAPVLELASEL